MKHENSHMKMVIPSSYPRQKNAEKMVFSTPEASNGRMIKPSEMRSVQMTSSNPPMLKYVCGEHVVSTVSLTKSEEILTSVNISCENQSFSFYLLLHD